MWRKLGIRDGARVATLNAPEHLDALLEGAPSGVDILSRVRPGIDLVLLFVTRRADLARRFPRAAASIAADGGVWVAYPKKASGRPSDLGFATVQAMGLQAGLVDNKSCAVDDVWTAVRFVVRAADRPGWTSH
ncbi:MAG: DUF3052 domain-containing protein [Actinomycetota bacterium]|nr:DUF3052 domain-containing protein [Actinomycetota bacterium]